MNDKPIFKLFNKGSKMGNKLLLGFLVVVAAIVATNMLLELFITDIAKNRFVVAFIGILIGMLLGSIISNYILKNIANLVTATKTIGDGDLTQEVTINSRDEIGELAQSFNQMLASLREMITQFRKSSDDIISASKTLSSFAQGINTTTEEVASISTRISDGAEKQSLLVKNTFSIMKRMADSIEMVAEKSQLATNKAKQVGDTAKKESASLEKTLEELEKVFARIDRSAELNREFSNKIQKITKFADIITVISEQTNLLSFNASIEATRAGEFGKGFSVVAEEVRRLAEKTKGFSEEITNNIYEIQKDNHLVLNSLDEQTTGIKSGRKSMNKAVSGLVDIMESIINTVEDVQEISIITQQQKKDAQLVVEDMENVSKLAEDHVLATEETVRSASSQVESVNKMVFSTKNLSEISDRLKNATSRFKLNEDGD
ncbi:MAG: methyl-accepting chemotaxis protein [Thermodesulfobacteriota bacterium]|nr:methyl-accepting chemotaxis protein [Thermodesulfobacteriota bacterium]